MGRPVFAVALCFPVVVFAADIGICDSRAPTAAEQKFHRDVSATLQTAMPRAPQGWQAQDPHTPELTSVCKDIRAGLQVITRLALEAPRTEEQEQRTQEKQAESAAEHSAALENPRVQAAQRRMEELSDKIGKAAERNDVKEMERLNAQLEKAGAELKTALEAPVQQMTGRAAEISRAERDLTARVEIAANAQTQFMGDARPVKLAGMPAYQVRKSGPDGGGGWQQAIYVVLLGKWRVQGRGADADEVGGPATRVRSLAVQIQADDERAAQLASAINWASLKSLLGGR